MKTVYVLLIVAVSLMGCKKKSEQKKQAAAQVSVASAESKASAVAQAGAGEWVKVELGAKKSGRDVYIEASSISDEAGYRKAWVLFDNKGEPIVLGGGTSYLSRKAMYLFSCSSKTGAYTTESFYKEGMGRGEIVFTQNIEKPRWLPGVTGSVFEATIGAACILQPKAPK
jgi:hypothetical protein